MSKNKDLIQILIIVIIGMFIPFIGSITINYNFDLYRISSTFGYFLLIFAIELIIVYLYFTITNKLAIKNLEKYEKKES